MAEHHGNMMHSLTSAEGQDELGRNQNPFFDESKSTSFFEEEIIRLRSEVNLLTKSNIDARKLKYAAERTTKDLRAANDKLKADVEGVEAKRKREAELHAYASKKYKDEARRRDREIEMLKNRISVLETDNRTLMEGKHQLEERTQTRKFMSGSQQLQHDTTTSKILGSTTSSSSSSSGTLFASSGGGGHGQKQRDTLGTPLPASSQRGEHQRRSISCSGTRPSSNKATSTTARRRQVEEDLTPVQATCNGKVKMAWSDGVGSRGRADSGTPPRRRPPYERDENDEHDGGRGIVVHERHRASESRIPPPPRQPVDMGFFPEKSVERRNEHVGRQEIFPDHGKNGVKNSNSKVRFDETATVSTPPKWSDMLGGDRGQQSTNMVRRGEGDLSVKTEQSLATPEPRLIDQRQESMQCIDLITSNEATNCHLREEGETSHSTAISASARTTNGGKGNESRRPPIPYAQSPAGATEALFRSNKKHDFVQASGGGEMMYFVPASSASSARTTAAPTISGYPASGLNTSTSTSRQSIIPTSSGHKNLVCPLPNSGRAVVTQGQGTAVGESGGVFANAATTTSSSSSASSNLADAPANQGGLLNYTPNLKKLNMNLSSPNLLNSMKQTTNYSTSCAQVEVQHPYQQVQQGVVHVPPHQNHYQLPAHQPADRRNLLLISPLPPRGPPNKETAKQVDRPAWMRVPILPAGSEEIG
ncbi:unnamed protein product [Amoebophrya sp. A25]|nr:unnamed protein product [Amoebophrya sp. A25]|eukprot:GSA25T00009013001.1